MLTSCWAWLLLCAVAAAAQTVPSGAGSASTGIDSTLKIVAERKLADWAALNATLESRLASLKPCDPRIKEAITEVSNTSDARLGAWQQYLSARLQAAAAVNDRFRTVVADTPSELSEAQAERGEIQRGVANIEVQKSGLVESMASSRIDLREAQNILSQIENLAGLRAADKMQRVAALSAASDEISKEHLQDVGRTNSAAHDTDLVGAQTELWRANYEARWVRAQVDCVTGAEKPARRER